MSSHLPWLRIGVLISWSKSITSKTCLMLQHSACKADTRDKTENIWRFKIVNQEIPDVCWTPIFDDLFWYENGASIGSDIAQQINEQRRLFDILYFLCITTDMREKTLKLSLLHTIKGPVFDLQVPPIYVFLRRFNRFKAFIFCKNHTMHNKQWLNNELRQSKSTQRWESD